MPGVLLNQQLAGWCVCNLVHGFAKFGLVRVGLSWLGFGGRLDGGVVGRFVLK